jgi:hypothetical protein
MVKWSVVKWDNAGGMQLCATAPIAAGEEILREKPLVAVAGGDFELGSAAWDLTHKLIADIRLRDAYYAWQLRSADLHENSRQDREIERLMAKRYGIPQAMVGKLHAGVSAFQVGYGPGEGGHQGYGLYQALGRANHSCDPSAELVVVDSASGEQALRAIKDILPGQEITRTYMDDASGFLGRNFLVRNVTLVSRMGFACRCPRCHSERPQDLKNVNLLQFFKSFLKAQAEKEATKAGSQGSDNS